MTNMEGKRVPETIFRTRVDHEWVNVSSKDIFDGKTVAVFSLPGAFTPTCSSTHVPRYNQLAPIFKKYGVDDIVCISVNDAFVMNEWKEAQKASRITFIPDGNGEFTEGMGMLVEKNDLGFGKRSWRYSMLVKDGVVEKMFVEPEVPGDPFQNSNADTMLEYLAPKADKPIDVTVFSRKGCVYCAKAKSLLHDAGIDFEELVLNQDYTDNTLRAVANATTYPQIFINGEHIGGSEDLEKWMAPRKAA
ncbi:MAG: glutathione peroxidase [Gammaproteobacteria bacterium]|nr:redoxin family protein [Gammaproteobacteria bacterium]NIN62371.1 redoxin family protein [Gammaproteobacteria bacterium]NIO61425.1 redoxin family protein [Gammaproteobacteria bacterium]NIP49860.1 glutathione peroxidase [Gammaproteobacteria bacterium]NIQ11893.1 glutathione peroxidase [Gammaproteobacteria bacterium]